MSASRLDQRTSSQTGATFADDSYGGFAAFLAIADGSAVNIQKASDPNISCEGAHRQTQAPACARMHACTE